MIADSERPGVLVIRAWVEGGTRRGLRVVVSRTLDVMLEGHEVSHAGTVPDVLTVVDDWLEALISQKLGDDPSTSDGSLR